MIEKINGDVLRRELLERGYAELEHGIHQDQFDSAIEKYSSFTVNYPDPEPETIDAMLPSTPTDLTNNNWLDDLERSKDHQQTWHKYRTNTSHIGKPNGYTSRAFQESALLETRGIDIREDLKEYYHWTRGHHSEIQKQHDKYDWGPIPPEVTALTQAFRPIHSKASSLIIQVCRTLEDDHPEITKIITPASLRNSPLRLSAYHHSDRPNLGGFHYDKSDITLQLTESHQGLAIAQSEQSPLTKVDRDPTKTALFMGKPLTDPDTGRYPDSPFHPGWHGILNLDSPNQGLSPIPEAAQQRFTRWSLIFFAGALEFMELSKDQTHVR